MNIMELSKTHTQKLKEHAKTLHLISHTHKMSILFECTGVQIQ